MNLQQDLFKPVMTAYSRGEPLRNHELYESLCTAKVIPEGALLERVRIGKDQALHNPVTRKIRWAQIGLRALGLLEKVPGERGVWRSTGKARGELTPAPRRTVLLGFSTKLGLALWGDCADVFTGFNEPIHCCLTSPPYCIDRPRAYGGVAESEYVDFICNAMEPIVKNLVSGGTIALNITQDVFVKGLPARSLTPERVVIAMHERLGLWKVDSLIWANASKAPGPIAWASRKRVMLNTGYEPIFIFSNDPSRMFSSNQRVLQPHTERHLKLIAKGGENRTGVYGDGANKIYPGSFGAPTEGRIPRNVLQFGGRCHSQTEVRKFAKEQGLPVHSATFPLALALAKFLIEYLTRPGDTVADNFAGWFSGPLAAELTGRRWLASERMLQYVEGARRRFIGFDGYSDAHLLPAWEN